MCSVHTRRIIFLLSCLLVVGCNSYVTEGPGPAVRVDDPKAPYATIRYNSVVFLDKSLSRSLEQNEIFGWQIGPKQIAKIAVETQGGRRTPQGTLEVFATFRNRTDFPLQLEGRVQFFDTDKVPIEGPSAWQRIYLPPNGVAAYTEKSVKTNAVYYYIEIRGGR